MKESDIMRSIQLRATELGARLWRNNVGQYRLQDGTWLRYGIQNPGGSDLIGFTKVQITSEMVGKTLAVFTAIEIKTEKGKTTEEQDNFIDFITSSGGVSGVARGEGDLDGLIQMPNVRKDV